MVIMLPTNSIGEPCEGKLHARFDEEGEEFSLVSLGSSPLLYRRGGDGMTLVNERAACNHPSPVTEEVTDGRI